MLRFARERVRQTRRMSTAGPLGLIGRATKKNHFFCGFPNQYLLIYELCTVKIYDFRDILTNIKVDWDLKVKVIWIWFDHDSMGTKCTNQLKSCVIAT